MTTPIPQDPAGSTERPETGPSDQILGAVEDAFDAWSRPSGPGSRASDARARPTDREPPAGQPTPTAWNPPFPPLFSPDPEQRRAALTRLIAAPADARQGHVLGRILILDPDVRNRRMAAEALARQEADLPFDALERALADPDDEVRAACVRALARRGSAALHRIAPLLANRRTPATRQAAVSVVPGLLEPSVADGTATPVLEAVASMDPPPMRSEWASLAPIAEALGRGRLIGWLEGSSSCRVGAARLLSILGDLPSLEALAALGTDPAEEVRRLAQSAALKLAEDAPEDGFDPPAVGREPNAGQSDSGLEDAMVATLARGLEDPDPAVRKEARTALGGLPEGRLGSWVAEALEQGSGGLASRAASVAQALGLRESARALLVRAGMEAANGRGPYLGALASMRLSAEELAGLVQEVDAAHRQAAVRLVWETGGRAVLPLLSSLLQDPAGPVRMAVLELLADAGDPSSVDIAQRHLAGDSSAAVRATAVQTLAWAPASVRQDALARALADPDPDVRATAVEVLPQGVSGRMTDLLLAAFRDGDERVWRAAVRHLATMPAREGATLWSAIREAQPERRDDLVGTIERGAPDKLGRVAALRARADDPADRALAIELAARAGTGDATAVVIDALADPDPTVRRSAASAMRVLRTPAAVRALSGALSDPHAEVRIEATRALGLIDDDTVPDALISALRDPEIRVRNMAAESLVHWQSPAVARRLSAALGVAELRESAATGLQRMGRAAIDPLVRAVAEENRDVALAAAGVLDRIAGPAAFLERLSSTDPDVRLGAVEVLGAMGGPASVEALMSTLSDPDVRVRARSAALLGTLGDARAVRSLRRVFLTDPMPDVATAAESALGILGGVEDDWPGHAQPSLGHQGSATDPSEDDGPPPPDERPSGAD